MDRRPSQRRIGGFRLRDIAWLVLACWLFALLVCVANDSKRSQSHVGHSEDFALEYADHHTHHDDLAQHEDACCAVLENLSVSFHVSDIPQPIFSLAYIVLPFVVVLQTILLAVVRIRFAATGPPGKPRYTLVANSLWPHAPPR